MCYNFEHLSTDKTNFADALCKTENRAMDKPNFHPEAVGARIELLRVALGLNQTEFAKEANILRVGVANWEAGRQRPGFDAAEKICDRFGVTLDWIFLGREETLRFEAIKLIRKDAFS